MNSLKENIQGKVVKIENGPFILCQDGFGCFNFTSGTALFGHAQGYGDIRVDAMEVERFATQEEEETFFANTGLEKPNVPQP